MKLEMTWEQLQAFNKRAEEWAEDEREANPDGQELYYMLPEFGDDI